MNNLRLRNIHWLGISALICAIGLTRAFGGGCAVSDGSELPSEDGCMLAFVYNQSNDHRLVILDEKNRQRYEVPLEDARMAPFWVDGKVYVVAHSGHVQGFRISADKLVAEKEEDLAVGVVREIAYVQIQHRLYLVRTVFDNQHKVFYELSAIDFPVRKTLWTKRIDDPGLLKIMENYICMIGLESVQAFNCDTGEKIGRTEFEQSK
jgi:hypothetical protein